MSYQQQPSTLDFLKLIGLLVVIGVIAFDIFSVRNKNKMLWSSLETQKKEFESKLKAFEDENASKEKDHGRKMEDAEKRIEDATRKAKDNQDKLTEEIKALREKHQKAMDEQRAAFEKHIQEMKDDFAQEKERLRSELQSKRNAHMFAQKEREVKSTKESINDGGTEHQKQPKKSIAELNRQIKANQEEINSLRKANPGCVLVDSHKQARNLETKFRPSSFGKYCTKDEITYVRDMFHCTACNNEIPKGHGPCCRVSSKRSFNLWSGKVHDAEETARINARIDELLEENEVLKKAKQQ